ncbi:TraB/GumN family protein [Sphingomonas aerophila]|nr:TraB/GumN family protein [Sphingomonas aerophila]
MNTPMKLTATAIALLLALPACAKQPTPDQPVATKAPDPNDADPALWVVKDPDTTIYFFGTIHVLKPGLTWFDEAVKAAFDKSDQVVLELVMPDPAAMQKLVMAKGMTTAGPTLTQQLPAAKRQAFTQALTGLGLQAGAFDRMRPWLAATNLSVLPLSRLGYDTSAGPEEVLTEAAKQAGKPVIGLETAEQQLGYFDGLSDTAQMQFLTSTVDELPTLDKTMGSMVADWAAGKPDALAKEMNDSLKDSPEVAKTLLLDRNKRWAGWIENRLKQPGTVFIAVGAGHLAGGDSVQAQLLKDGVKAQRVAY